MDEVGVSFKKRGLFLKDATYIKFFCLVDCQPSFEELAAVGGEREGEDGGTAPAPPVKGRLPLASPLFGGEGARPPYPSQGERPLYPRFSVESNRGLDVVQGF